MSMSLFWTQCHCCIAVSVCLYLKGSYEMSARRVVRQAAYAHFYPLLQPLQSSPSSHHSTTTDLSNTHSQHRALSNHQTGRPLSGSAFCVDRQHVQSCSRRMTDLWSCEYYNQHGSSDILTTPLGIQSSPAVSCQVILAVCKHSVNPTCLPVKLIVWYLTGKALSNTDPCRT